MPSWGMDQNLHLSSFWGDVRINNWREAGYCLSLGYLSLKWLYCFKKGGNMQIYCLNDDRGLAGFTHTVSEDKNTKKPYAPLRKVDGFDQKGLSKNVNLHVFDWENKQWHFWEDVKINERPKPPVLYVKFRPGVSFTKMDFDKMQPSRWCFKLYS